MVILHTLRRVHRLMICGLQLHSYPKAIYCEVVLSQTFYNNRFTTNHNLYEVINNSLFHYLLK